MENKDQKINNSLQENIANKVDDLLLEKEILLEEKRKTFDAFNDHVFGSIKQVEENAFDVLSNKLESFFNEMRYQKMSEILNDSSLTPHQKELQLQDNLLNVYQLQNKVEELLLDNSIQLENINEETQDYLKNSFVYGEEFLSKVSTSISSLLR